MAEVKDPNRDALIQELLDEESSRNNSYEITVDELRDMGVSEENLVPDPRESPERDPGSFEPDPQPGSFVPDEPSPTSFVPDEPDTSGMKAYVEENLKKAAAKKAESTSDTKEAETFLDGLEAGWDVSVSGLMMNKPDMVLPENAGRAVKIASMIGQVAGDIPFMVAGGVMGAAPGAAMGTAVAPGPGTAVGAVIGAEFAANALPEAYRQLLMDHYEKGDITEPGEFLDRMSAATWQAIKGGTIGAATFGAGRYAGKAATRLGANGVSQAVSKTAAEIATMTSMNAAIEGHLPSADDIANVAIVIGGLSGSLKVASKIRKNFVQTGESPYQLAERVSDDVVLKQEMVSVNDKTVKPPEASPVDLETLKDTPPSRYKEAFTEYYHKASDWYKRGVDDLSPIKDIIDALDNGKELPAGSDPYQLARNYRGVDMRAYSFERDATRDFHTNKVNGEGLHQIYKEMPDLRKAEISEAESAVLSRIDPEAVRGKDNQWKKINAYRVAKRAIELSKRERVVNGEKVVGVETGIDIEAAKKVVAESGATLEPYVKRIQQWSDRALQYYFDSAGTPAKEQAAIRKLNQEYVPFHRLFEQDPFEMRKSRGKPLKKISGSTELLEDPEMTYRENAKSLIRAAEKNRIYKSLVEIQENAPKDSEVFLQKRVATMRPLEVQAEEVSRFLRKHGFDDTDIPGDGFSIFRPMNQSLADNEFQLMRNGKREVWQIHREYADILKGLNYDPGQASLFIKMARIPTRTLRLGTVLSGEFILRNIFRDQVTAGIQSKYGQLPFLEIGTAIGNMWKNSSAWQDYMASGAFSGGAYDLKPWLDGDLYHLNKQTRFIDRAWNVIRHPIHAAEVASTLAENIPRFNEFRKSGAPGGDFNAMVKGAMGAREVTVDFQRGSINMRVMSSIVPFAGAQVQGLDRMLREFSDPATRKQATMKALATITLPSILLWWANKDDSRVKESLNWEKDLYWQIPTDNWEQAVDARDWQSRAEDMRKIGENGEMLVNNGIVFRIPKPFEVGVLFGSFWERALDGMYRKDPGAFKDFDQTILDVVKPNMLPTIFVGISEQLSNHSYFLNTDLVSPHTEMLRPEDRYSHYTSETAKQIAKLIGYAPKIVKTLGGSADKATPLDAPAVVDNYLNVWGGTNGKYLVQLADRLMIETGVSKAAPKPAWGWGDVPVIKAFIKKYPTAKTEPIRQFYERFNEANQIYSSMRKAIKEGNQARYDELVEQFGEDPPPRLSGVYEALGNANKALARLQSSAVGLDGVERNPDERYQLMTTIWHEMTQMAREGNAILDELEKKK